MFDTRTSLFFFACLKDAARAGAAFKNAAPSPGSGQQKNRLRLSGGSGSATLVPCLIVPSLQFRCMQFMEITILSHSPFLYFFLGNPPWQLFSVCQSGLGICSFTLFLFFSFSLLLFPSFALSLFCSLSLFHSLLFALSFLLFALLLFRSSLFSSSLFHSSLFSSSLFSSLLFRSLPLRSSTLLLFALLLFHFLLFRSFALRSLLFALCSFALLLFFFFALLLFRSLFFSFALGSFALGSFALPSIALFALLKKVPVLEQITPLLSSKRGTGLNCFGHSLQKE